MSVTFNLSAESGLAASSGNYRLRAQRCHSCFEGRAFCWINAKPDGLLELKEIDGVDTDSGDPGLSAKRVS